MAWQDKALCKEYPEINFIPERPGSGRRSPRIYDAIEAVVQPAKDVCKRCSVKQECLDYQAEHKCFGIWGGIWFDVVWGRGEAPRKYPVRKDKNSE